MSAVPVLYWNPANTTRTGLLARVRPQRPHEGADRKDNFGDLLGPLVVRGLGYEVQPLPDAATADRCRGPRLLSVGSIMRLARDGDIIWGTGVNGKSLDQKHGYRSLDVRAVRGPRTQAFLRERGIDAPNTFGDPALLLPLVRPDLAELARGEKRHALTVIPNLNDVRDHRDHPAFVSPQAPIETILRRIAQSERVVGSALHGIVVAEALGVPAVTVWCDAEAPFKYLDYFEGTGRPGHPVYDSVDDAVAAPVPDGPAWDATALVDAFPGDVWPMPVDTPSPRV